MTANVYERLEVHKHSSSFIFPQPSSLSGSETDWLSHWLYGLLAHSPDLCLAGSLTGPVVYWFIHCPMARWLTHRPVVRWLTYRACGLLVHSPSYGSLTHSLGLWLAGLLTGPVSHRVTHQACGLLAHSPGMWLAGSLTEPVARWLTHRACSSLAHSPGMWLTGSLTGPVAHLLILPRDLYGPTPTAISLSAIVAFRWQVHVVAKGGGGRVIS